MGMKRSTVRPLVVFTAIWIASIPFSLTYSISLTPYGPMADGDHGYARARAFGLAQGSLVAQTRNRCHTVGWEVQREDILLRLWPFTEGDWPVRTNGVPLPLLAAAMFGLSYWRRSRLNRRNSEDTRQQPGSHST